MRREEGGGRRAEDRKGVGKRGAWRWEPQTSGRVGGLGGEGRVGKWRRLWGRGAGGTEQTEKEARGK